LIGMALKLITLKKNFLFINAISVINAHICH
jgi:hypothetical protein